ncbi:acid phosphatase [gut metagenome]|uniref:Acid phosphatase n=1 Tax=gut metagenome TaxID=749906 RepID=J9H1G6_9ZZZZ
MSEAERTAALLPPPPAVTESVQTDELAREAGIPLRAGERGDMARYDSKKVSSKWIEGMMSPVLGVTLGKKTTPALHRLIAVTLDAAKASGKAAKLKYYGRLRPFVLHPDDLTCDKDARDHLNEKSSYPSGHTTAVWAAGLALSAAVPEKADKILDRAFQAGESRWICGHHWKSDVEAGRALAAATYAGLTADPDYLR